MPTGGGRSTKARRAVSPPTSPVASTSRRSASESPANNSATATLKARLRQAEAITQIHLAAVAPRPKNTRNAYLPRQKEWRACCDAEQFDEATRYTVTGDKLAFFLKKCVVGRAKKKGGRSKKDAPADDDDETGGAPAQTVAWQTVDQYIATIVNLYEDQRRAGVDSHAHPRGGGVEEIMATMRRGVAQKKGLEFTNRGIGTYLDGYNTVQQLEEIALHLLGKNTPEAVRELAMNRLSFGGVMRGHHVRECDFADLHSVVLEDMGYTRCVALVLVLDHGKTNPSGRLEMAGMIRAKKFLTCPLFAVAMHFFELFHNANLAFPPDSQSFPSFAASSHWYNLKAFSSPKNLEEPMKYETHRNVLGT